MTVSFASDISRSRPKRAEQRLRRPSTESGLSWPQLIGFFFDEFLRTAVGTLFTIIIHPLAARRTFEDNALIRNSYQFFESLKDSHCKFAIHYQR